MDWAPAEKLRNKLLTLYCKFVQNIIFVKKLIALKKQLSLLVLLFLLLSMASCKPTSTIITSKQKAIQLNKYQPLTAEKSKQEVALNKTNQLTEKKRFQADDEAFSYSTSAAGVDEFEPLEKITYKAENADFKNELVESAEENIGSPYQTGGMSKNGFDCSGFVFTVFKNFDVILPRTSNQMSSFGRILTKDEIRKGDLIFFKTNGSSRINHVGIVLETTVSGIKFIHSSTQKGVIISTTNEGYYQKTFAQVNRVVE